MNGHRRTRIAVIGSGSWGSALAIHLCDAGMQVQLWSRREELAETMRLTRENTPYLPSYTLPASINITSDLQEALDHVDWVFSVLPSQATRVIWQTARPHLRPGTPVVCASKGIELGSLQLMSEVLASTVPGHPICFLGGPSFAREVAAHVPTAVVVGSQNTDLATEVQYLLSTDWLRAYITHDVIGLEIGGALKNIVAIACGCADGLGLGNNTRAALMTRGLAEMTRLAVQLGADPMTLAGLGGMGDLVLTCTGDLSRNRRVGLALGQGNKLSVILQEMGQVAEGVETCTATRALAEHHAVEMPITEQVSRILHHDKPVPDAVRDLMRRNLKHEQH
ncbi:MAG: NAD(P)-dependent glycerol-3-phosphate dehydrogenase [Myxococcales bacterium]|nr:NAD(P)-dependent glycerol-3-phosphate dehydrogenase [Myxococcales bacterium]